MTKCKCCGKEIVKQKWDTKDGFLKRAYCSRECSLGTTAKKHGYCSRAESHPLYDAWRNIKRRCYYKNSNYYKNYGGRGITVCEEWRNSFKPFLEWAMHNGWEIGLTIDRTDVNGNYEPSNCRWITQKAQLLNRRNNRYVTYKGETKTAKEWASMINISYTSFLKRLNKWGDINKAMEEPVHESNVRHKKVS